MTRTINLSVMHIAMTGAQDFYDSLTKALKKHGDEGGIMTQLQYSTTTVQNEIVYSAVVMWELPVGVEVTMDDIKQG